MKRKIVISIVFLMGLYNTVFCQFDTAKIKLVSKTLIFLNLPFRQTTESNLIHFLKEDIQVEFIKSAGFSSNIVFVKVDSLNQQLRNIRLSDGDCLIPYIIAVEKSGNKFYRISGFLQSDLLSLLNIGYNNKHISNYSIAGIDIKCMYEGLNQKHINYEKYSCLKFCGQVESIK
ncbi:MAG: hypothetical protein ACOYLO_12725 [Ferruginibacter sp.]